MSFWQEVMQGAARGAVAAAHQSNGRDRGRIDRLCRELGWSVDERAANVIHLHFSHSGVARRVRIADGDECIVTFSAESLAAVRNVTGEVMAYLLARNVNGSGIGTWGMCVEGGRVWFHVLYQALGDGLDAPALKYVCESLVGEAADFDVKLRQSGLPR